MNPFNSRAMVALLLLAGALPLQAQPRPAADPAREFTVFLRARAIGQESVAVVPQDGGWVIRGSNRLGPPLDVVTRTAEIQYDAQWRPLRMRLDGSVRGNALTMTTSFANGQATSEIAAGGTVTTDTDAVAPDVVVLPNTFLGSYAALARRLVGAQPGATLRGYIAPQGEVGIRVDDVYAERIETPQAVIAATRYALSVESGAQPQSAVAVSVWTDPQGALLRMSVPSQTLEVARDDVASAAARTTAFSIPGDESVRIPASGFNLAASIAKPANATGRLPAIVLVGGGGDADRDGTVAGIPIMGQLAAGLVDAGFLVVRYDRRGIGQSGGRAETATLNDYAEDVRAILKYLDDEREDVDDDRMGVVGYGDGAWVAMRVADRDDRVKALALVAGAASTGANLVLEQQQRVLAQSNAPAAEQDAKIALQKQINRAVLEGDGWEEVPEEVRSAADTPWFQSFLAFDPARVMRDVHQPVLIVHGELDQQVPVSHADRLAELARARRRNPATELTKVPGVNHLLVPATTGAVAEYGKLADRMIAPAVVSSIASWMTTHLR